jgi:hypothetical protein
MPTDDHSSDDQESLRETRYSPTGGFDAHDNPDIEVTDDELDALKDEVDVLHAGSTKDAANKLMEEKALGAIISISKLATDAVAERVRLDASRYIVERVLGPLSKMEPDRNEASDPVTKLLKRAGMIAD